MSEFSTTIAILLLVLGIRNVGYWLQSWQMREYRLDRMRAYYRTREGHRNIYNLWFYPGFFPRPQITVRMMITLFFWAGICVVEWHLFFLLTHWSFWLMALVWERTVWLSVTMAVYLAWIPASVARSKLFWQAYRIREKAQNLTVIGITGSFGKTSTKTMLVEMLKQEYGAEQILFNPENQNNETMLARLILKHKRFFTERKDQRFFVAEMGAYRRGEIALMCKFIQPDLSIITAISPQHMALFGSQENITHGKWELATATREKVYYNADNHLLKIKAEISKIEAEKVPVSIKQCEKITIYPHNTEFVYEDETYRVGWGGDFFVMNALLALRAAQECKVSSGNLKYALEHLPIVRTNLKIHKHQAGFMILEDLYAANPDGVFGAIKHLARFRGRKVFVCIPLKELGEASHQKHKELFHKLNEIGAEVYWWKDDFSELGRSMLGTHFHGANFIELYNELDKLKTEDDAILLESRLPHEVVKIFL